MSSTSSLIGGSKKKKESDFWDFCPKLTYQQRLYGFIGCAIFGWIITLCSFINFRKLMNGDPAPFAICYTMGNLICIFSTCFLSGPKSQSKKMVHSARRWTVLVFFISMVGTICFSCIDPIRQIFVCILFIIAQFCSYFWYTLSYIPFGQRMFKKCCKNLCDFEDGK